MDARFYPVNPIWTDFTTPVLKKGSSKVLSKNLYCQNILTRLRHVFLFFTLSITSHVAWAEAFTIRSVETSLINKVYTLSAQIEYRFSDVAIEALQNGVPLLVLIDIEVERERSWWLDKNIAELQQGYLLLYHALTEKYIVNNLNSGAQENYDSFYSAVNALGKLESLPILDANLANKDNRYIVRLHTYLDLEALPAPMRPLAYISSQWRLESDWYEWPLQH